MKKSLDRFAKKADFFSEWQNKFIDETNSNFWQYKNFFKNICHFTYLQNENIWNEQYIKSIRPFNLHPEKWFEGYPVKSTQIFIRCTLIFLGCRHALIFLGYSLIFFSDETQLFQAATLKSRSYPKVSAKIDYVQLQVE